MPCFAPGLVACVTGAALVLAGAKGPSVVVWPADGAAVAADVAAVEDAGFEPVGFAGIKTGIDAARAEALNAEGVRLGEVRQALDGAQAKFLEQDWDAMVAELVALEGSSLALLAAETSCAALWELEFRHGLALFSSGATGAAARFRFAAALDPDRRPPVDIYGPDVAQAFLAAVEAHRADVKQPIALEVDPSDSLVTVDCRPVSAHTVRLAPGFHVVRVEAPAHPPTAVLVDTRAEQTAKVVALPDDALTSSQALGHLPASARLRIDGPTWFKAIGQAADAAGADAFVWLAADAGRFNAQVLAAGKRGRRRVADGRTAAIELALEDLADDGRIVMGKPKIVPGRGDTRKDTPKKKGVARKWWFWTIIGGIAVAAVAVGLGVGLTRGDGPSRLRVFGG